MSHPIIVCPEPRIPNTFEKDIYNTPFNLLPQVIGRRFLMQTYFYFFYKISVFAFNW
jgi:hypothetical protein